MADTRSGQVLPPIAITLLILIVVGAAVYFMMEAIQRAENRATARKDLKSFIAARKEIDFTQSRGVDPWGTPYHLRQIEDEIAITYLAQSAGPDKKLDTSDDLFEGNSDLNWTKTGQAIGVRTGRTARGFFKGLKKSGDGE